VEGRRNALAVAAAGLIAALAWLLLGLRSSSGDLQAAVAEFDASVRETGAAVQARAETLAQLPRLGWAVATDESTMRDLTAEELAFRPQAGEHIEITQVRRDGGESRPLLRLPVDDNIALPLRPGKHLVVRAGRAHLVAVVSIEPRERASELTGILAVAKQVDTSALGARLAAHRISAVLRTDDGAISLPGAARSGSGIDETIALAHPQGTKATIAAANVTRAPWARFVSPLILVAALAAAAWLWRRGGAMPSATATDRALRQSVPPPRATPRSMSSPALPRRATPPSPLPAPVPDRVIPPSAKLGVDAPSHAITEIDNPPAPPPPRQRRLSGHVDVSLARSGSVSLPASETEGLSWPIDPTAPPAPPDTRTEEYRALFAEFVTLRRTTGESVEGLNVERFIALLRATRVRIMKQIPVKDVRFNLAFQNGKAAIRYQTVP
jgi:hypothetical protein